MINHAFYGAICFPSKYGEVNLTENYQGKFGVNWGSGGLICLYNYVIFYEIIYM